MRHGVSNWKKLDNTLLNIEVTDSKGDISTVTGCEDETGNLYFIVRILRLLEDLNTRADWCSSESITIASEQANLSLSLSIDKLMIIGGIGGELRAEFSDLSDPRTIVASAYGDSSGQMYLYRKLNNQLDIDNTYTLDFLSIDAIELDTFTTSEENGFRYSYAYRSAASNSWGIDLNSADFESSQRTIHVQGIVPTSFVQAGDLFEHRYQYGDFYRLYMASDNQTKISNPLSTEPEGYMQSDFTISADKTSLSFIPKTSQIDSLNSVFHIIGLSNGSEYEVDAERFSEDGNSFTLVDFNNLPGYSGDIPERTIVEPFVMSYFDNGGILRSGKKWLFISTKY